MIVLYDLPKILSNDCSCALLARGHVYLMVVKNTDYVVQHVNDVYSRNNCKKSHIISRKVICSALSKQSFHY